MKINDATGQLNGIATDWKSIIIDHAWCRSGLRVQWDSFQPSKARLSSTWSSHTSAIEDRQYTFRLLDDSVIQIYYDFSGGALTGASLSYLEGPRSSLIRLLNLKLANESLVDAERYSAPGPDLDPLYFRIDYSPNETRKYEHPACHLHISSIPDTRIPVNRLPTPAQFFEFCIRSTLPSIYYEHRLKGPKEDFMSRINRVDSGISSSMDGLMGISVPSTSPQRKHDERPIQSAGRHSTAGRKRGARR